MSKKEDSSIIKMMNRKKETRTVTYHRIGELDGALESEAYYADGKLHRDGGPAYVEYGRIGDVIKECWFQHGLEQREDGPAAIEYSETGEVTKELWFHHGKEFIPSPEQVEAYRNRVNAASTADVGMVV